MQILQANPKHKKHSLSEKNTVELQLINAQMEIKLLRQQNKVLNNRIAQLEKQHELFNFLQDELTFRKSEQDKMAALIVNYQEISSKLQEKMRAVQNNSGQATPKELAATTIECTSRNNEEFELQLPVTRNFRASCTKRTNRSDSFEKQKENHPITPKTRVNIDLSNIFEDKLPIKKKVFL